MALACLADATKPEYPQRGRRLRSAVVLAQTDASRVARRSGSLESKVEQQKVSTAHGVASKTPFPSGWFGDFSQAESTFNREGVDASLDYPERSVMHGRDPSLPYPFPDTEVFPSKWFHESQSAGPVAAWQTHYPAVSGSIAGNRGITENPWQQTPEGWFQDYKPMFENEESRVPGPSGAAWFDNSVRQIDGFGRRMTPDRKDGRFYVQGGRQGTQAFIDGWQERSVNTTITCKTPGCTARASLQLFDGNLEEARLCSVSVDVHPTDYDDDWSREHVAFWKANDFILTRQCNPRARGCNSTADRPLYPCVNGMNVDKIVDSLGTLVIEGQNTHMVDECPYNGNLLSAVALGTCMVRPKPNTTAVTAAPPALFTLADLHGNATLKCNTPGCEAETIVHFSPALALNGGKCLMNVTVHQTDFDDHLGVPEQIDFLRVEGTNLTKAPVQPGKNPCNLRYQNKTVTEADEKFLAVKSYDVTKLATQSRPLGALRVSGKISEQVDECGYKNNLLYAMVTVECTPPAKFAAKPPALNEMTLHTPLAREEVTTQASLLSSTSARRHHRRAMGEA